FGLRGIELPRENNSSKGPYHVRLLGVGRAVAVFVNRKPSCVALHVKVAALDTKHRPIDFETYLASVERYHEVRNDQVSLGSAHDCGLLVLGPERATERGAGASGKK